MSFCQGSTEPTENDISLLYSRLSALRIAPPTASKLKAPDTPSSSSSISPSSSTSLSSASSSEDMPSLHLYPLFASDAQDSLGKSQLSHSSSLSSLTSLDTVTNNSRDALPDTVRSEINENTLLKTKTTSSASLRCSPVSSTASSPPDSPAIFKKSGERVKSSLRLSSLSRCNSVPGDIGRNKSVRFNEKLEDVRHFNFKEKPQAVSSPEKYRPRYGRKRRPQFQWGSSSSEESADSDDDFSLDDIEKKTNSFDYGFGLKLKNQSTEWSIKLPTFHKQSTTINQPVLLEEIKLSENKNELLVTASVSNISFSKAIVARFTVDQWRTTSEVRGSYSYSIDPSTPSDLGRDLFIININLKDIPSNLLRYNPMFICIRYDVDGREFWDSNSGSNYRVDFQKVKKQVTPSPQQTHKIPNNMNRKSRYFKDSSKQASLKIENTQKLSNDSNLKAEKKPITKLFDFSQFTHNMPANSTNSATNLSTNSIYGSNDIFGDNVSSFAADSFSPYSYTYSASGFTDSKAPDQASQNITNNKKSLSDSPNFSRASRSPSVPILKTKPLTQSSSPSVKVSPGKLVSSRPSITSSSYQDLINSYCFYSPQEKPTKA